MLDLNFCNIRKVYGGGSTSSRGLPAGAFGNSSCSLTSKRKSDVIEVSRRRVTLHYVKRDLISLIQLDYYQQCRQLCTLLLDRSHYSCWSRARTEQYSKRMWRYCYPCTVCCALRTDKRIAGLGRESSSLLRRVFPSVSPNTRLTHCALLCKRAR